MKKNNYYEEIDKYFKNIELKNITSIEEFNENLINKYGDIQFCTIIEKMMNLHDFKDSINLYDEKNKNLELSIDFNSYSIDLYKQFLLWQCNHKINPKTILDIGCDNGIVTCFLAMLYPNAEIIGVDISSKAIDRANELADKLNLKNIIFINEDINNIKSEKLKNIKFDMIISIRSIHEINEIEYFDKGWSIEDERLYKYEDRELELMNNIYSLLADNGEFISFDRIVNSNALVKYINLAQVSDFEIKEGNMLKYNEVGEDHQMPLIVFKKKESYNKEYNKIDLIDLLNMNLLNGAKIYEYLKNELLLNSIEDKTFVYGYQFNYSDANFRIELWRTKNRVILYESNEWGYRDIRIEKKQNKKIFKDYINRFIFENEFEFECYFKYKSLSDLEFFLEEVENNC